MRAQSILVVAALIGMVGCTSDDADTPGESASGVGEGATVRLQPQNQD